MVEFPSLPDLGVGIIYFPGLEPILEAGADVLDVIEVEPQPISRIIENRLRLRPEAAAFLAAQPQTKLVHSVGAPVGGTIHAVDMLDPVEEAVELFGAPWASEHLNFDRFNASGITRFTNFLLPAIQSAQTIQLAANNIQAMQTRLGVPVAVETPVNYLQPVPGELSDGAFLAAVIETAGCGLLLDLHNLWCNERNGRETVLDVIAELPAERIWEVHLAGGQQLDGYWVDAHSGLVEVPLWELAEDVVCRLPNLKAITFEVMPEYLTSGRLNARAVVSQLERMQQLWKARGSRPQPPPRRTSPTTRDSEALPDCATWERALGDGVTGMAHRDELLRVVGSDRGVAVYQKMVRSVRIGVVVDTLRLTYRLLALTIGPDATETVLRRYLAATPGHPIAHMEAQQFTAWLLANGPDISHLREVVTFEQTLITAHTEGRPGRVRFTREPMELLEALGAGRLPAEPDTKGDFVLEVTA